MIRLRQRRSKRNREDEQVLPLINVVFLLLIFFMITGRLVASDPFDIEPLTSPTDKIPQPQTMLLLVGLEGQLALDGAEVDEATLHEQITTRLKADPQVNIHLKADGRADATQVVAVMELLREAGIAQLQLLTIRGPEGQ